MCGRGRGVGRAVPGLRVWAKQHYGRAASCWGSGGGAEVNPASEGGRAQTRDAARGWGVLADICSSGPAEGALSCGSCPPPRFTADIGSSCPLNPWAVRTHPPATRMASGAGR